MNRLLIPSILATTVLVAGMFAFMPVQKASTIHSSLSGSGQVKPMIRKGYLPLRLELTGEIRHMPTT